MTYPLLVALERDEELRAHVERVLDYARLGQEPSLDLCRIVQRRLHESGAVAESQTLAAAEIGRARACLAALPASEATRALELVAEATLHRRH
jgi:geranylgeranyl pyrophosphate synthase